MYHNNKRFARAFWKKGGIFLTNELIRTTALQKGVKLWEIAERIGLNDGNFSRKLRRELPQEEQERILCAIEAIQKEHLANEEAANE